MQFHRELNLLGSTGPGSQWTARLNRDFPAFDKSVLSLSGKTKYAHAELVDNPAFLPDAAPADKEALNRLLNGVKAEFDNHDLLRGCKSNADFTTGLEMIALLEALVSSCHLKKPSNLASASEVLQELRKLDLHAVINTPQERLPADATPAYKSAMQAIWHLAQTPVGTAVALRLTKPTLRKACTLNKSFETHLHKLLMYFFKAQEKINNAPRNKSTVHMSMAMQAIRQMLATALTEQNDSKEICKTYIFNEEIRKLPSNLALSLAALRNNVDLDDVGTAEHPALHIEVNQVLEMLAKDMKGAPLRSEGKVAHYCRVAKKILGGKIGSPVDGIKYLTPERPPKSAAQLALEKYENMKAVISLLNNCIEMKKQDKSVIDEEEEDDSELVSKRHSSLSLQPISLNGSNNLRPSHPALRNPLHDRAMPANGLPQARPHASSVAHLRLLNINNEDDQQTLKDYARKLLLGKLRELTEITRSNPQAAMAVERGQKSMFGSQVIAAIMATPDIQCLPQSIRGLLKNLLTSYNAKLVEADIFSEWRKELESRLALPGLTDAGDKHPKQHCSSTQRMTKLKGNNAAETMRNAVKGFESLAEELHFGYQVKLNTESGHQVSTQGVGAIATGGIADFYAKAAYSKGANITLGNNSIGTFLEYKRANSIRGGFGASCGVPLLSNPVIGISAGAQLECAKANGKGISINLSRDKGADSDQINKERIKELTKFLIEFDGAKRSDKAAKDNPAPGAGRHPSKTLLMALLEQFPDVSISLVEEKKVNLTGEISGRVNVGPKTPALALNAYAQAGGKLTKDLSDVHYEALGPNRRDLSSTTWSGIFSARAGMQAGVDLRELIGNKNNTQTNDENLPSNVRNGSTIGTSDRSTNNASTKSPSSSNERVGQAANNLINAKGLLHPHAGVNVTLHSSSTQIAVHTKDGEIQPGTSWRMKVFTKAAFLSWLQRNRETIIDELSKAIVLKSCGETESSAANTLYQERRIEHAKQLSEYIEKVRNHTDSNATYAINYDFTKAAAADVNRYRAAEMSCRKLNMLQEAEKWANEAKAVIHDPKSYVLTSLLANHDSFHGSSMSVGLIAYGKHGSGAYERSFEIFSGNPSKNIPLQVELENDPDEDEIALEPHLTEERQAPRRSVARHSLMQMNLMRHLPPANINHIRR